MIQLNFIILTFGFGINQISESDTAFFTLDSVYYRYHLVHDTSGYESFYEPILFDTVQQGKTGLRISGVKDFSFDMTQGFDQGLKVNINGELEGVRIEGNLSDKATPSSTARISDIEKMNLKIFTKNFYGGIGTLTLPLPFGIIDEIQGGRFGIHSEKKENNINIAYAVNRGSFKRIQFVGEEGKQSPYFLEENIIVGSERVYSTQGIAQPVLLFRDKDYTIDYEKGIISFTNEHIITNHTRIEVEYQQALEDYPKIYEEIDGQISIGGFSINSMYRRTYDEKENPLNFTLSPAEIESLKTAGDSMTVSHTFADTSSQGSYNIEDDHFVYVGERNGTHAVTFFYTGENNGDYIYDPILKGFSYQGPGLGNYSPTKFITSPRQDQFYACGLNIFESINIEGFGSYVDKNTFSAIDDSDNYAKGGRLMLNRTFGIFSINGGYLYYDKYLSMPTAKENIDYQYQWNTDEPLEELGEITLGIAPLDFLTVGIGYGILNRTHKRKSIRIQPWFFQFGYESIDGLDTYIAGVSKTRGKFMFNSRLEYRENSRLFYYDVDYTFGKNYGAGLSGNYDKDTTGRGITTVLDIYSSPVSLSLGHRLYNDTTFLFGNAAVNISFSDISFHGRLGQSQRYSQKRDETYIKVDEGEGNYVYDSVTNSYIEKEGGDYLKKIFLLEEFDRVITRNYSIEGRYTKSVFDVIGRFNYLDEEEFLNHTEDFLFIVSDDIYSIEWNVRQHVTEDARYALFVASGRERLLSLTPSYRTLLGHAEIKEEIEKYGEFETERRNSYSGDIGYSIFSKPLVRPKIAHSYSKIFSQYFEDIDIHLHTSKMALLFGLPIMRNKGRLELTSELIYRLYNIDDVPYFFGAVEPPGLTKVLGVFASLGIGNNTLFSLFYRIEFPPLDDIRQNLRFQTRIRF